MKKLDLTKPNLKTADGHDVEIVGTDLNLFDKSDIAGVITAKDGSRYLYTWSKDGKYAVGTSSGYDLVPNVEVLTIAEVVKNALDNFEKLQCIAGPLEKCSYLTPEGTRCVIGWSISDPENNKYFGSLSSLRDQKLVEVEDDESSTLYLLQSTHDQLCSPKVPPDIRRNLMRTAISLASTGALNDAAYRVLAMAIDQAKYHSDQK